MSGRNLAPGEFSLCVDGNDVARCADRDFSNFGGDGLEYCSMVGCWGNDFVLADARRLSRDLSECKNAAHCAERRLGAVLFARAKTDHGAARLCGMLSNGQWHHDASRQ